MPLTAEYSQICFDECFDADGAPRPQCEPLLRRIDSLPEGELSRRQKAAEISLHNMGITFAVYGHSEGTERVWPCDVMPRVIAADEWTGIQRGLVQRMTALNLFLDDVYNDQKILKDKAVPEDLILGAPTFQKACLGLKPPQGVWCHISGVDLVRDADGTVYVLEDNLRCPSGVSYVLENREVMKRTFPVAMQGMSIAPIEDYPERLLETLLDCAPTGVDRPNAVLLTPGIYNSAYFEHTFLAQQMGIELVQPSDLLVDDGYVWMRTTRGLTRVDVIYRRVSDEYLDPAHFNPDSMLGVTNLMDVYLAGRVSLANAPGTGIADDKAVYTYVPTIVRYYLGEDPILPNVPTFICEDTSQREHVLANLHEFVVKPTNESGGYGIVLGPRATDEELVKCGEAIRSDPRNWIAQPMLQLSTVPTLIDGQLKPRHVDLRPFVLSGKETYVMPGGLTRVALVEGSMIVNSSQGGGSKDTWVLKNGH